MFSFLFTLRLAKHPIKKQGLFFIKKADEQNQSELTQLHHGAIMERYHHTMALSCGGTIVGDIIVDGYVVGDITTRRYHPRWHRRVVIPPAIVPSCDDSTHDGAR